MEDVKLQLAANTAQGMAERLYPAARGRICAQVKSTYMLKGRAFSPFVHLVFFLIENAVRYSELPPEELEVLLFINTQGDAVTIEARNLLGTHKDLPACIAEMNDRIAKLQRDLDFAKVRSKGGTGLAKVLAIISLEFGSKQFKLVASPAGEHCLSMRVEFEGSGIFL